MPTAAEHRAEAASLERVLETLAAVRTGLTHDRDDVGVRGPVALLADGVLGGAVGRTDELARLVDALADELRRRAVLCDRYTDELRHWRDADVPLGPPPAPPFSGATAG